MIFIWIITTCIFSDIGGFVFGKIFGKTKLTKISSNKTYEGAIGSTVLSYIPILSIFFINKTLFILNYKFLVLTLVLSLVCQSGDILFSFFKRINNKKDTGSLLPGHGGVLDRIDGILCVLMFSYFIKLINII